MNHKSTGSTDALLVIDVQNDFCAGGALEVPDANSIVPRINKLIAQFSTVVFTQDWHPAHHSSLASEHSGKKPMDVVSFPYGDQVLWPDHCVQGSAGAQFHPDLTVDTAQMIVRKGFRKQIDSYSAFFENDKTTATGLSGYLKERGVTRLFCVGLATDFCVYFSALDAKRQGFETVVIHDACRGIDISGSVSAACQHMIELGIVMDNTPV